jgi:negative regulator of sigma-B (phosphoserine phosphatase)
VKVAAEHISEPCQGFDRNGDALIVRTTKEGTLVAVVDALGHGPTAADIAERALAHLVEAPLDRGVSATMQGLHEALRGTRGAAAMISLLRDGRLEGCGVGNVELRSIGAYVPVMQSPGILGVRVRRYNIFASEIAPGARLVLFSDGISAQAPVRQTKGMGASEACQFLFRGYRRSHDDATILVVDVKE